MNCENCDMKMLNVLPRRHEQRRPESFWFECPKCGRRVGVSKFPEKDHYLGKPLTPMADPYGYEEEDDTL